jgi:hypothetical protein
MGKGDKQGKGSGREFKRHGHSGSPVGVNVLQLTPYILTRLTQHAE